MINFSADISPLVTPHIPARSTTKLSGKAVLDTNRELVLLVLLAGVLGDIQLNMLRSEMQKVIKIAEIHFWPKNISTKKWPKNYLK